MAKGRSQEVEWNGVGDAGLRPSEGVWWEAMLILACGVTRAGTTDSLQKGPGAGRDCLTAVGIRWCQGSACLSRGVSDREGSQRGIRRKL